MALKKRKREIKKSILSQIYQIRLLGLDEVDEVVDLFQVWPDDVKQVDQLSDLNLLLLQLSLAILIAFLKWKKV